MVALKSQITPPRKEGEVRKKRFVLYSSEELSWVDCHMYQIKKSPFQLLKFKVSWEMGKLFSTLGS